jgi:DNA-binding winged helix-turn-helix (wHTH) protein
MGVSGSLRRRRRSWRFEDAVFDEAGWMLRVGGKPVALESKPLEVLHELLLHAGEVVTKEELLDAVWPGVFVVEGSLATAISKLRKALGPKGAHIVQTAPRIGYRLAAKVNVETADEPLPQRFDFVPGDRVPRRVQWVLRCPLDDSGAQDVWLGEHEKTGERRVFKFADAPDRLRALKREAALTRLIMRTLGVAAPVPSLIEWDFEQAPYRTESAFGGADLLKWATDRGGLGTVPLPERLAVAAKLCRGLALVHDLGILHKDLKPANILIADEHGERVIRLADFGSGQLLGTGLLDTWAITDPGTLGIEEALDHDRSGTAAYRAPELAGDAVPTVKSDIYALGLVVFQLVVGDFQQALAPGWEQHVADPVLRRDIADAAAGDPDARMATAAELAERLERLDERRTSALAAEATRQQLSALQEAEAKRRLRRPWLRAAVAASVVGFAATSLAAGWAFTQRARAMEQQSIAEASYSFLAEDLLAKADPAEATGIEETMGQVLNRAGADIEQRFAKSPWIAARLYQTVGRALAERAEYDGASRAFAAAEAQYGRAGDRNSQIVVAYQSALATARSVDEDSLAAARQSFAAVVKRWGPPENQDGEAAMWAFAAAGYLAIADSRAGEALHAFQRSAAAAAELARPPDPRERIALRQRIILAQLRLDRMEDAERGARTLAAQASLLLGADHPDTLLVRLNLAQALLAQQKNEAIIAEATAILPLVERRFGADHPRTLQLLGSRMDGFKNLERYVEARQDGERLWRSAERRFGPRSFYAVGSRLDTARVRCRSGDTAGGLEDALAAYRRAQEGYGGDHALTHGVSHGVADCLIAAGRPQEAKAYLVGLNRRAVGELVGNKDWGLHVELLLAQIAVGRGEIGTARRHYNAAQPAFEELMTDAYELRRIRQIERRIRDV